jgi:hypothetical protein
MDNAMENLSLMLFFSTNKGGAAEAKRSHYIPKLQPDCS